MRSVDFRASIPCPSNADAELYSVIRKPALEQAKNIDVLDWWNAASQQSTNYEARLQLKVGKSLLLAAQNRQAEVIAWWAKSGISTGHEDAVARTASTNGHVDVLQQWRISKGDKMQLDNRENILMSAFLFCNIPCFTRQELAAH